MMGMTEMERSGVSGALRGELRSMMKVSTMNLRFVWCVCVCVCVCVYVCVCVCG